MSNLIPFQFESSSINVIADDNGEPWFNANEVCDVLGFANSRKAISDHVDEDDVTKRDAIDSMGRKQQANHINESGLYALIFGSTKDEAKRFKRWVTHEVLPALRNTGNYTTGQKVAPPSAIQPSKEFRALFGIARLVGLDKNAATLSANQAVTKLTGTNVMQLLGHTHLEAENQTALYFTPTELGDRMKISGRKFNMLLAEAGLQAKKGEVWAPLPAADGFCRIMDTGKRHGDGTMVQQIKWSYNVLSLVQQAA